MRRRTETRDQSIHDEESERHRKEDGEGGEGAGPERLQADDQVSRLMQAPAANPGHGRLGQTAECSYEHHHGDDVAGGEARKWGNRWWRSGAHVGPV
ncbi:MAG: hypothetical protein IPK85_15290 [Gemmatimonadetes bacterium]|nr:hypothetical protein [Gemmatimonadota bacterium]